MLIKPRDFRGNHIKTSHSLAPIIDFVLRERNFNLSPRISVLAAMLPPVPCAGFEFSLEGTERVDLQQRIRGAAELGRLRDFLHLNPLSTEKDWAALSSFCQHEDAMELAEELWLELDDLSARIPPPLSLFVKLPYAVRMARSTAVSEAAILQLLHTFGISLSVDTQRTLRKCLLACRDGAAISHLGLMVGREQAPLRLIIELIPADDFGGFLKRAGLRRLASRIQTRVDKLFVYADRIRLALTLTERLDETVGLECFVGESWQNDARLGSLFDQLLGDKHGTHELSRRLLAWPKSLLPHQVREGWPGVLIAQALGNGPEQLSWLDCRFSHVKLNLNSSVNESAKAYFGFLQVSRATSDRETDDTLRLTATGGDVLERGCDALLGARTQGGWWLDYPGFTEGTSDEWVSAYVACACLETSDQRLHAAAERIWQLLSARPREGWGWNFLQPADADSTAWALRLAQSLGRLEEPQAKRASAFLTRHIATDGGVATYLPESHRVRFPSLDINPGWYHAHLCVTAAVAGLGPLVDAPLACLLREQQADGSWRGYWWAEPAYATATAVAVLSTNTEPAAHAATIRAAHWAQTRLSEDIALRNDPFALALLMRTSLHAPTLDWTLLQRTAHHLAALQLRNGLWPGTARLNIPNGAGVFVEATDCNGIFTTATVLVALYEFYKAKDQQ